MRRSALSAQYRKLGFRATRYMQFEQADAYYQYCLQLQPQPAEIYADLGYLHAYWGLIAAKSTYEALLRLELAAFYCEQALTLQPDLFAAYSHLVGIYYCQGHFQKAIAICDQGSKAHPWSLRFMIHKMTILLLHGELERGLAIYEAIIQLSSGDKPLFALSPQIPRWHGESLFNQRLLLYIHPHYWGHGDTLQTLRYLPLVLAHGGKIHLQVQPELEPLCRYQSYGAQIEWVQPSEPTPAVTFYASMTRLPHLFRTQINAIPGPVPYLQAPPLKHAYPQLNHAGFKIGIVWKSAFHHSYTGLEHPASLMTIRRMIPLDCFLRLMDLPLTHWYSLQFGKEGVDYSVAQAPANFHHLGADIRDFTDTAAFIQAMDLIITVDTALAHLAGALGKPVWVLLVYVPDWRWLLHRSDSPWYPTMHLFRQTQLGSWSEVFVAVRQALLAVLPSTLIGH